MDTIEIRLSPDDAARLFERVIDLAHNGVNDLVDVTEPILIMAEQIGSNETLFPSRGRRGTP